MTTLIILLAGWSTAQAFPFCFSFGPGGNKRADFYGHPPPAVGFGRHAYYVYPYSPVYPAPSYMPYYPPHPPAGLYGGGTPRPPGSR